MRREKHEVPMTFPPKLAELQIGSFVTIASLESLPPTVVTLQLIGEFFNKDLENVI